MNPIAFLIRDYFAADAGVMKSRVLASTGALLALASIALALYGSSDRAEVMVIIAGLLYGFAWFKADCELEILRKGQP